MKLENRTAIITGSSSGIGRAIALQFAREGANVVVNFVRSQKQAEDVANEIIKSGGMAVAVKADVSHRDDVAKLVSTAIHRFGKVDVLVNNAGHASRDVWYAGLEDFTDEMWDRVMEVDVKGTLLCCKESVPHMKKQGYGKIINVSSIPAMMGDVNGLLYSIAKAGIIGLTKSLAKILAPEIRVNTMAFGSINTGWIEWLTSAEVQELIEAVPLKRLGETWEAANLATFLASEDSDFITGQTIVIDGGEYMH